MQKSELRKKYKALRRCLSPEETAELSRWIFENFKNNFEISAGGNIHIFLSSKDLVEVDTAELIRFFFEKNCRVFVPKVLGEEMRSVEIFPNSHYQKNQFGIYEPESQEDTAENNFDYVVVPLLYCDGRGNRVGYGKGFYDRFFQKINRSAKKVGLNFFPPKEPISDASPWDVPLDYLVLPDKVLSFNGLSLKFTK